MGSAPSCAVPPAVRAARGLLSLDRGLLGFLVSDYFSCFRLGGKFRLAARREAAHTKQENELAAGAVEGVLEVRLLELQWAATAILGERRPVAHVLAAGLPVDQARVLVLLVGEPLEVEEAGGMTLEEA